MNTEIGVGGGQTGVEVPDTESGNTKEESGIGALRQCCKKWCPLISTILIGFFCVVLMAAGVALILCECSVLAAILLMGLSVAILLSLASYGCNHKKEETPMPQGLPEVIGNPGALD